MPPEADEISALLPVVCSKIQFRQAVQRSVAPRHPTVLTSICSVHVPANKAFDNCYGLRSQLRERQRYNHVTQERQNGSSGVTDALGERKPLPSAMVLVGDKGRTRATFVDVR